MSNNDVVLLQRAIARDFVRNSGSMTDHEHQNYFVSKHYLRAYEPGLEDIRSGIVDGGKDCGIDSAYIYVNGFCIRDDTSLSHLGRRASLDLILLQVKNTSGFGEAAIDKLLVNLPKLLDFNRDEKVLQQFVNPKLIEITRRFLVAYENLDMPELSIYIGFASLKAADLHANTVAKAERLKDSLRYLFRACTPQVDFLGASELSELMREPPIVTRKLRLSENPISTDMTGGYIGVVRIADYENFITTETGELDSALFEANVRDYEGESAVNGNIAETLETADSAVDFWWLNNGVTIVASQVQSANKRLELVSPQIVNGLQTSTEIFKRKRSGGASDSRSVLVKVIEATDENVRERIIRATNSQTAFGPSALKATDVVQRQIEEYLLDKGLFYERRRRHYLNANKPVDRIISIDYMGQALLSAAVQAPHTARAEPSRVFDSELYDLVFGARHPLPMFHACLQILRQAEDFLTAHHRAVPADDFKFHLAMLVTMAMTRKENPSSRDLASLENVRASTKILRSMLELIQLEYDQMVRRTGVVMLDQLSKDPSVTGKLMARGRSYLRSTRRDGN
jgi:hypothetical protein